MIRSKKILFTTFAYFHNFQHPINPDDTPLPPQRRIFQQLSEDPRGPFSAT